MKTTRTHFLCALLLLCLLAPSALAAKKKEGPPIPERYWPILDKWNATNGEELLVKVLELQKNESPLEPAGDFTPKRRPCSIRFGGTTKDLISDKKNWDLAIVSSKDVDLQKLADEGLIMQTEGNPAKYVATSQWLAPEELQRLLPVNQLMLFYVLFYDYDKQTNDATLPICQADIGKKKNHPRTPFLVAFDLMDGRSADEARSVEGICRVENWTEEDLIARTDEWDVARITIDADARLERLDQAGLLYDFSQDDYFASRTSIRPFARLDSGTYHEMPYGILSADGRMIGIPSVAIREDQYDGTLPITILNAKSTALERARGYAIHYIKSLEWFWNMDMQDTDGIPKDEIDW